MKCSRVMVALGSCLLGVSFGCSKSTPSEVDATPEASTHLAAGAQRLWSFDLSDERAESMTLEQLWQVGVECLRWPTDLPADATKTDVHARLMEAKYRHVGDFGDDGELDGLGYEGE